MYFSNLHDSSCPEKCINAQHDIRVAAFEQWARLSNFTNTEHEAALDAWLAGIDWEGEQRRDD